MNNILLINNIGNRHLYCKYNNNELLYNEKLNFRKNSQVIFNEIEKYFDFIEISNILKPALEKFRDQLKNLILIVTDQGDNNFNTQDTLFAGEILKYIISKRYTAINVDVLILRSNPTDENNLINDYRFILNNIIKKYYSQKNWIYLDAGGTPQQKFVFKLLLSEFKPNCKIDYQPFVEGYSNLQSNLNKYKSINNFFILKNVKSLIKLGHYDSAYDLLATSVPKNKALPLLQLAKYQLLNINNKKIISNEENVNHRNNKKLFDLNSFKGIIYNKQSKQAIIEGLLRSKLHLDYKRYSLFILSFQITIETFLIDLICGFNNKKSDYFKANKILSEYFVKKNADSIPFKLKYIQETMVGSNKLNSDENKIITIFNQLNKGYSKNYLNIEVKELLLDDYRNKVAHEGKEIIDEPKYITEKFYNLFDILNLDYDYWNNLNKKINDSLFL